MYNFNKLNERYLQDATFNRLVNVLRQLFEEFGFLPDEIRQASFLAQMQTQINSAQFIIRTQVDIDKENIAREIMKKAILDINNIGDL